MFGARLSKLTLGANQHTQGLSIGGASKTLNVSERSIERAKFVLKKAAPEDVAAIDRGERSVSSAYKTLKLASAATLTKPPPTATHEAVDTSLLAVPELDATSLTDVVSEVEGDVAEAEAIAPAVAEAERNVVSAPRAPDTEPLAMPSDWLWPEIIPVPGVTLIAGCRSAPVVPLCLEIAATVSWGSWWPTQGWADPAKVVWATGRIDGERTLYSAFEEVKARHSSVFGSSEAGPSPDLPIRDLGQMI